jgi:hypothetical protein
MGWKAKRLKEKRKTNKQVKKKNKETKKVQIYKQGETVY